MSHYTSQSHRGGDEIGYRSSNKNNKKERENRNSPSEGSAS